MKGWKIALLLWMALLLSGCGGSDGAGMSVVSSVDLQRYSGRWLELAKIPNRFQADCQRNASAEYRLLEGGQLEVVNRCITPSGEEKRANGVARVVERSSGAKLEVSFVRLLGMPLFWGDYWILALGSGYEYVVVGTPSRQFGWVLAREPHLSDEVWREIEQVLEQNGYSLAVFERTLQGD